MNRSDHSVPFKSEKDIRKSTNELRRALQLSELANTFDIVNAVERVSRNYNDKGPITLHVERRHAGQPRARVAFYPNRQRVDLFIDDRVWALAKRHHPKARHVLAHELGHLYLHEHYEQNFSRSSGIQTIYPNHWESAEWQANNFAANLLVTDSAVIRFGEVEAIAYFCKVELHVAKERFDEVHRTKAYRQIIGAAGVCNFCGDFIFNNTVSHSCASGIRVSA